MALSRRRLLAGAVGAGIASALGGRWLNASRSPKLFEWRLEGPALGTTATILALHPDKSIARRAAERAFDEIRLVESLMSIYRPDSQVSRLNASKTLDNPHPYFIEVLNTACEVSRLSEGAFDVTVGPLWKTHAGAHRENRAPTTAEVAAARARVDWRRIELSPKRIRLRKGQTEITLNGIAQGFAADRALSALAESGACGLVNAGELASLGHRADRQRFRVGIQHPRQVDAYAALVSLDRRRLATSGDYETAFSADFCRCHIFDPRTGESPAELASVSILAPSATLADALSTAAFVLGPDRGRSLIESFEDVDGFFILKDGRAMATENFPLESVA